MPGTGVSDFQMPSTTFVSPISKASPPTVESAVSSSIPLGLSGSKKTTQLQYQ